MDMAATFHEQRVFFSTSRRQGEGVDAIDGLGLRPALFAGYRDLSLLRHDFPLVLVAGSSGAGTVRSLSGIVDEALLEVAPRGIEGERLRKHALALEREIRARVAAGDTALLEELWTAAAERVSAVDEENAEEVLRHTAAALKLDGEVVGCDVVMPAKFLAHLWEAAHAAKAHAFRQAVDTLVVRLSDILRAAFIHSAAGQQRARCVRPWGVRTNTCSTSTPCRGSSAAARLKDELSPARRRRYRGCAGDPCADSASLPIPKASPSPDAIVPFDSSSKTARRPWKPSARVCWR